MEIYHDENRIYIKDERLSGLSQTNYNEELWNTISNVTWTIKYKIKSDETKEPQYLYSSKLKKYLHQVVFDYYFGEDFRKKVYEKSMIIEHLDNDGFDCTIENLYFLLDVKNKYKGNYFDKLTIKSIPVVALRIYHIIENKTFQVTMGFNEFFQNSKTGEFIHSLKLLYDTDYWTVVVDAESILEDIVENMTFNIEVMKQKYRFKDYRITLTPSLELTEEVKNLPPGNSFFMIDGQLCVIQKGREAIDKFRIKSTPYDKDWGV